MPRRVLVVVGLAMGLTVPVSGVSISAGATQQPASAAAPTQSFVGGGTGTADVAVHWPVWDGHYTSSGQLGRGHYQFWTYNNTATFTRSDGMTMSGPVSPLSWPRCTHDPQALCMHADVVGARDIASAHLDIALTGEANDLQPAPTRSSCGDRSRCAAASDTRWSARTGR